MSKRLREAVELAASDAVELGVVNFDSAIWAIGFVMGEKTSTYYQRLDIEDGHVVSVKWKNAFNELGLWDAADIAAGIAAIPVSGWIGVVVTGLILCGRLTCGRRLEFSAADGALIVALATFGSGGASESEWLARYRDLSDSTDVKLTGMTMNELRRRAMSMLDTGSICKNDDDVWRVSEEVRWHSEGGD